ncbi:TPA: hypothetical protein JD169_01035 [Cronobacter malonaticus]|nr:hypothetical protein [Cronobacter malonaticus]
MTERAVGMYVSPAAAPAGLYITFTSFYIQNSSESAATIMIFIEKTQPPKIILRNAYAPNHHQ